MTEAENISKELYGDERLLKILSANTPRSDARSTVNTVVGSVAQHVQEAEPSDDLTVLLICYKPEILDPKE